MIPELTGQLVILTRADAVLVYVRGYRDNQMGCLPEWGCHLGTSRPQCSHDAQTLVCRSQENKSH
jgi:hypothetical protein